MKILPTKLFLNYNKTKFSGIQRKDTFVSQETETLSHLNALTTRIYFKIINNNPINFGQKTNDKENKELDEAIKISYLSGENIREFCRNKHISTATYYTRLNNLEDIKKIKEMKQKIIKKNNQKLTKEVLTNYKNQGNIEKFCQKKGICQYTYYKILEKQGIHSSFSQNKYKELDIEIRKNHESGGSVKQFCKEHNILKTTYFNRLHYGGEEARKSIEQRRSLKKEQQQTLREEILENYKNKGNVNEFCKRRGITPKTYYRYIQILGIDLRQENEMQHLNRTKILDEEIKQNHESGGQIVPFCKAKGISTDTYYKRLKVLGLNLRKSNNKN